MDNTNYTKHNKKCLNCSSNMEHHEMSNHNHMHIPHENHCCQKNMHEHKMMDHSMHMGNLKQKFIISLILSLPIFLLAPIMNLGRALLYIPFNPYIVIIISTVLFFYGGKPFLSGAKMEIEMKAPAMMTLISLGISVAYLYSLYAFIANNFLNTQNHIMDFSFELASLILIMLLGHWIEMRAVSNAGDTLKKIANLLPNNATIIDNDGQTKEIAVSDISLGELVLVKAGQKFPTDGVIIKGTTSVNESMITGESKSILKTLNSKVIGGTINEDGTVTVKVSATGKDSYLSQVIELVKKAQAEKSKVETLSSKVAKFLFYIALTAGIISFIVWFLITQNLNIAFNHMVTVLIIACPHALGLAIPLVAARSIYLGAKNGLLIKNRKALEMAKKVKYVFLDKTGTLTEGRFTVNEIVGSTTYSSDDVLSLAAGLEQNSTHPLALSICQRAKELNLKLPKFSHVKTLSGSGITGNLEEQLFSLVSVSYLRKNKIAFDEEKFKTLAKKGNSISFLIMNQKNIGFIAQSDAIKPNSFKLIKQLKSLNITPVMLTGDNKEVANEVAKKLGITNVFSELLPVQKENIISKYKNNPANVMMVGDGINDAPSLTLANIGIAIGAGTDVALDSADVILTQSNPLDIIKFLNLAKNTQRKMLENLWWGAGYNFLAIPLAAGALSFLGINLTPAIGAIIMSLSTIIVAINALLLKP